MKAPSARKKWEDSPEQGQGAIAVIQWLTSPDRAFWEKMSGFGASSRSKDVGMPTLRG
jgi:hypothetical protein